MKTSGNLYDSNKHGNTPVTSPLIRLMPGRSALEQVRGEFFAGSPRPSDSAERPRGGCRGTGNARCATGG